MRLRALLSLPFLATFSAPALAQPTTGSIPRELVAAMFTPTGGYSQDPDIVVGAIPKALEGLMPAPRGARVIGGMTNGYQSTAYFAVPGNIDSVSAQYARTLADAGWKPPATPYNSGGFRSASTVLTTLYCRDSLMMQVYTRALDERTTRLTITRSLTRSQTMCRDFSVPITIPARAGRLIMPVLQNPTNSEVRWYDKDTTCFWNEANAMNSNTTELRSAQSLKELMDHYARQLVRDGWQPLDDNAYLTRAWQHTDSTGARQIVTLTGRAFGKNCRAFQIETRR